MKSLSKPVDPAVSRRIIRGAIASIVVGLLLAYAFCLIVASIANAVLK